MFPGNAESIPAQVQFQAQSLPAIMAPTTYEVSPFTRMAAPTPVPPGPARALRELRGEFEEEMDGVLGLEAPFDWGQVD